MQQNLFRPWTWFKEDEVTVEIEPIAIEQVLPSIVLVHGANASNLTFAHIRSQMPTYHFINIDYSSSNGFYNNLDNMIDALADVGPVYLVGHSLGGIFALHLSQEIDVIGGTTISTPFGGSKTADWAKYMSPHHQVFKDVGVKSKPIVEAKEFELPGKWHNFVSTAGTVPWHGGQNDGVLTVDSMSARQDMRHAFVDSNHYEIVVNDDVISSINNNFIKAVKKNG